VKTLKLIDELIAIARAEVGVREVGDNGGKRVLEFQAADTLPGGNYAWCASYAAWCIREACKKLKAKNPWCNSASCDVILAFARSNGILHETPQVGDVFLVMASKYDATHTGIVSAVTSNRFREISGNTNSTGSRSGNGVYEQWRDNGDRYKFVRWIDLITEAAPVARKWTVTANEKPVTNTVIGGEVWIAAREFGDALGLKTTWNASHQTVVYDGKEVPLQVSKIAGDSYLPLRRLCAAIGVSFKFIGSEIAITK